MKIRYVGPSELPQYIPAADLEVAPGETVDVLDDLGESLTAQDTWERVGASTIDDVLNEVDDDPEKAQAALEVEQAKDHPRKKLIEALTALVDPKGTD